MSFVDNYVKHRETWDKGFEEEWKKGQLQRELSTQLIELRLNLGMNQTEFAKLIGVKQPFLSRLENGEQNITIQSLEGITRRVGRV